MTTDRAGWARWRSRARLERAAIWLWLILGGAAVAALTLGVFWWWIVLFVTIPFLLLAYIAPTAFLYLTLAGLPYALLRLLKPAWADWRALAGGAVLAAGIGVVLPLYANRQIDQRVAALLAADVTSPGKLAPAGTIALLSDAPDHGAALTPCDEECQRLLFTGAAEAVLVGSSRALADPAYPVTRHALVPQAEGCVPYLFPARVDTYRRKEALKDPDRMLAVRLADFGEVGRCLRATRVAGVGADLALVHRSNVVWPGESDDDWRLVPLTTPFTLTLLRRTAAGWQTAKRQSDFNYRRLTVPLTLIPMNGADTSVGTRWGAMTMRVQRINYELTTWLAFDDRIFDADGKPTPAARFAVTRVSERAAKSH